MANGVGDWEIYQFNSAVFTFGRTVENELAKNAAKKKGSRKEPEQVLRQLLYPDSQPVYASLGNRAQTVKVKPGDDPVAALLRGK